MKTYQSKRIFYISTLSFLITLVVFVFVFSTIHKTTEQLALLRSDLETELSNEGRLRATKEVVGDTEMERAALTDYFVTEDETVTFINVIEEAGQDAGVALEISRVDTASRGEDQSFEDLVIELQATGSWANVFQMLTLLERLPYATSVERVTLEEVAAGTDGGGGWRIIATLTAVKLK